MSEGAQPLPKEVLAKRSHLEVKLKATTLSGQYVRLELLDAARDTEPLYAVSNGQSISLGGKTQSEYDADALIWRYMGYGPFASVDSMRAYAEKLACTANGLALCVFDQATNTQVGVATFMNNYPEHLKIELGNIWYSPIVQRTPTNTETILMMLQHAFALGYRRVEWKCDALNERSRQAALRLGFRFEGVQEYHLIVKDRNRDTAWFRILDHEWPVVEARLQAKLRANKVAN